MSTPAPADGPMNAATIFPIDHAVRPEDHWRRTGHRGGVLWFTGLSGAGKSTIALGLEQALYRFGYQAAVLDGDSLRAGLNADLGFSPTDRHENIRRVAQVAALFAASGTLVVAASISPYREDRQAARRIVGAGFHEVFVKADLETCEGRDPKGLYARARSGALPNFTGVSAPYETPTQADLEVDTAAMTVAESVDLVLAFVDRTMSLDRAQAA